MQMELITSPPGIFPTVLLSQKPKHSALTKIVILGRPGSGKTTFAQEIGTLLALPVFHVDKIFFKENWKKQDTEIFQKKLKHWCTKPQWVIDGNATSTLKSRLDLADLVILFDFPRLICLYQIFKRRLFKDTTHDDRASGCRERVSFDLILYMWKYKKRVKLILRELNKNYPHLPCVMIHNTNELRILKAWFYQIQKNNRKKS